MSKQGFAEDYIWFNERIVLEIAKYPEGSIRPLLPVEPYRILNEDEIVAIIRRRYVEGLQIQRWEETLQADEESDA